MSGVVSPLLLNLLVGFLTCVTGDRLRSLRRRPRGQQVLYAWKPMCGKRGRGAKTGLVRVQALDAHNG